MRWLICVCAMLSALVAVGANAGDLTLVSEGVGQTAAQRLTVRSERLGRDFQIDVWTPNTRPWLPGQKAAAAYILDGGYGMAGPIAAPLGNTNALQAAYIVTVGYPAGKGAAREIDLLFGPGTRPNGTVAKGGGGEAFTAFLLEDLKPFIEARYPVAPDNAVLMGHSLAGIYVANVLARRPDAFAGFVIASPSLWADPGVIQRLAAVRPGKARPRVFVAYGGAEVGYMVEGGHDIARAVRKNAAFEVRAQVFEGGEHLTYYPALVPTALGYVLPRKARIEYPDPIAMPAESLARLAGSYRLTDGRTLGIALVGSALQATRKDRPPLPLEASAADRLFVPGLDVRLRFMGAASAPPGSVIVSINGDDAVATRTSD